MSRWHTWAPLLVLIALILGTAVWSVSTSPGGIPHHAMAAQGSHRSTSVTSARAPSSATTTTTPPQRLLTISSTDVSVGEEVTVTGTGCPPGHWGTPLLESDDQPAIFNPGNGGLYPLKEEFDTSPGTDPGGTAGTNGQWTMVGTVAMIPPGPATLTGSCRPQEGGDGESIEFNYLPGLRVIVTSPDQLEVEQGPTAKPGTMLEVNLVGGTCPGASSPVIYLYSGSDVQLAPASASTVAGWQYAVAIPSGLTPGQYRLEADCVLSRGAVYGSYAPTTITVQ